jgi:NitT/TauT family transport system substrate-binding protein
MGDFFVGAGKLKEPVDPKTYYLGDLWTGRPPSATSCSS